MAVLEPPQIIVKAQPKFIVFGRPDIGPSEIEAVTAVLKSGWLSTGPVVKQLEKEFQEYMGSGYAVAVSSCTMGLMLSMAVSCLKDTAECITSPLTFPATVNAMFAMRLKPIFVDVNQSGVLDTDKLYPLLMKQNRISSIVPVHYGGASADMREVMAKARQFEITVIEDAAHAFGTEFVHPSENNQPGRRQKIGTISDFAVFSFYPTKNITGGEGGMVMTKHADVAERIRILSMHGLGSNAWDRYGSRGARNVEALTVGYKGNMSDIHAAIALAQLRRWPELLSKRTKIWNIYEDAFGWREPGHSRSLFMIRVKDRETFRQRMFDAGIGTGVHYKPLHLEPGFRFLGYKEGDFPNAEKIGAETVSLPVSSTMTEDDAYRVVEETKKWIPS
jgi:dTDP-4-amino-4,6-dideoxygalactose transaminase